LYIRADKLTHSAGEIADLASALSLVVRPQALKTIKALETALCIFMGPVISQTTKCPLPITSIPEVGP